MFVVTVPAWGLVIRMGFHRSSPSRYTLLNARAYSPDSPLPATRSVGLNQLKWLTPGMSRIILRTELVITAYEESVPVQEATLSASLQMKSVGTFTVAPSGPHAARPTEVFIVGSASEAKVVPPPPME